MYSILLYQTTGEIQTYWTSDSLEEIKRLWEESKAEQDEYTEVDEELVLYHDEEVLEDYQIVDSQRA